jgi:hypothetical protein
LTSNRPSHISIWRIPFVNSFDEENFGDREYDVEQKQRA